MNITVVVGPPCAGKSTWVELTAPSGAARVDFEKLAAALGSPNATDVPPVVFDAAQAARRGVLGWVLDPDQEHPVGELYLTYSFIAADTISALHDLGARFVLIDPGESECVERAESGGFPQRTVDAIHRWYADPPELPGDEVVNPKGFDMTKVMRANIGTLEVKAAGDGGAGTAEFEAYASVFGNVDSYGDVMVKGAFARSLAEWAAKDAPVPALWGHNMSDPDYNIGHVVKAEEDDHGLRVKVSIDLDSPKGATVYRLLKSKRVREMSFAFWVKDYREGEKDGAYVRYVEDVDLIEVSVVPMGANPEAEVLAVRSAGGTPPPAVPVVPSVEHLAKATADANAAAERLEKAQAALDEARKSADEDEGESGDDPEADPDRKAADAAPIPPEIRELMSNVFKRPGATNS